MLPAVLLTLALTVGAGTVRAGLQLDGETSGQRFIDQVAREGARHNASLPKTILDGDALVVPTEYGRVRGSPTRLPLLKQAANALLGWTGLVKVNATEYPRSFLGIPFAAPPVGKNRFREPQQFEEPWGGIDKHDQPFGEIRSARLPSFDCPQPVPFGPQSEDCLYLNIYTPSPARIAELGGKVPVLFWLFPGAFICGSNYQLGLYDGSYLAGQRDVIVVTSNYRVGPFGFYAATDDQGNAALLDQRMAMEWVKRNIGRFGGDSDNVTLWGLSAGAYSILIHLTSPSTPPGLFHKVITQSAPIGHRVRSRKNIRGVSRDLARQFKCLDEHPDAKVDMDCMRAIPWQAITMLSTFFITYGTPGVKEITDEFKWWPSIDGRIVKGEPRELMMSGDYPDMPIIMGHTKDEAALWSVILGMPILRNVVGSNNDYTPDGYRKRMKRVFGNHSSEFFAQYPVHEEQDDIELETSHCGTDMVWRCPINAISSVLSKRGRSVFTYELTQPNGRPWFGACYGTTCHMSDTFYLWKHESSLLLDRKQDRLAEQMQTYWTNFAKTGNVNRGLATDRPSTTSIVRWSAYSHRKRQLLELKDQPKMVVSKRISNCKLWNRIGYDY